MSFAPGVGVLKPGHIGDQGVVANHEELGKTSGSDPGEPGRQNQLKIRPSFIL